MQEVNLDIQEINLDDAGSSSSNKEISIDQSVDLKEANFGSGIELLMNDKVKNQKKSPSSNSLKDLENELNSIDVKDGPSISLGDNKEVAYKDKNSFQNKPVIQIAKATSEMETKTETWDGFKDINSINLGSETSHATKMNKEQMLKEKFLKRK